MPRGRRKDIIPLCEGWSRYMQLRSFVMSERGVRALMSASRSIVEQAMRKASSAKRSPGRTKAHAMEVENIAFQFLGRPTPRQARELECNIGGCRWLWNRMLADNEEHYRQMGTMLHNTPAEYKNLDGCGWLNDLDSYGLCNVQMQLEKAYRDFFSGRTGRPRFKKKHFSHSSYTTNKDKRCSNIRLEDGLLTLPKITGPIRVTCHRKVPDGLTLKSVTVSHEPDGRWLFSVLYERPAAVCRAKDALTAFLEDGDINAIRHIGLDMSLPHMYIDSFGNGPAYTNEGTGDIITFEKQYRKLERRIAKEQRRLSRMQKGSQNYGKQCAVIARLHAKAKHGRLDFIRQTAVRLARTYDIISIEDLDMRAVKRSLRFGKSVSDNGWGLFVRILEEKCGQYGAALVRVDRWFPSSKTCCKCGYVHKELTLSDRTYICPHCGHVMDRDEQAAVNIDIEGMRVFLTERPPISKDYAA